MNRFRLLLTAVLLMFGVTIGLAGSAAAHNVLTGSDPADGSTIAQQPAAVTLTFDQPVNEFAAVVTVTGPDGNRYQTGDPVVDGNSVSTAVLGGPAGKYAVAFRVISADGHPVTGQIRYTVTGSGASGSSSAPVSGNAPSRAPDTAADTASAGLSGWLWAAIAMAGALVAAAVLIIIRRPRDLDH